MAARVQVIVEAKDAASGVLRGIASQFGAFGNIIDDLTTKNVNWGNLATSAATMVYDGLKQSIQATMEYAEQVRDLSLASGQSAEESSRMLQVMDDFQLSAEDATMAVRALTKEGLAPTMDTLAQLADEYVKLNGAQEKNEFILKNLGRSGLQWANMLSKGGAALREMSDSVDQNLILTDKNVQAAEEYRLALDQWNDAVQGLKVSLGNELLPVLADVLTGLTNFNNASVDLQSKTEYANMSLFERAQAALQGTKALNEQEDAARALEGATGDLTTTMDDNTGAAVDNADAMKTLSRANQAVLSNMFALQSASESYAEGEADRAAKLKEIEAERIRLGLERNTLQAQGALTIEKQNQLTAEGLRLEQEYRDVIAEGTKALEDKENAGQRIVYNMLEQRAAADGLVSSDEVKFLQDTAVTMGLVDRASADAAIQAAQTADTMWAGFVKVNQPMTTTAGLMNEIASHDGQTVDFQVLFSWQSMTGGMPPINPSGYQPYGGLGGKAAGGPVYANTPYVVGEEGPEVFVPRGAGEIIPNGAGRPVNIYISGDFKSVNDLDYLAQEVARRIA